jgi:hypothetical protein
MSKPEEFAMGDITKDYCIHCARADGSMQSFSEKLESLADFITKTQGFDEKAARASAREMMARLPAWQRKG